MKKTYLYAAMEKIDEDIEELETRSVRDEKPHVKKTPCVTGSVTP